MSFFDLSVVVPFSFLGERMRTNEYSFPSEYARIFILRV